MVSLSSSNLTMSCWFITARARSWDEKIEAWTKANHGHVQLSLQRSNLSQKEGDVNFFYNKWGRGFEPSSSHVGYWAMLLRHKALGGCDLILSHKKFKWLALFNELSFELTLFQKKTLHFQFLAMWSLKISFLHLSLYLNLILTHSNYKAANQR